MNTDFNPNNLTYGFIGLGLIGGSMAKAIRKHYPSCKIVAYNRSRQPREDAKKDGTADIVTDSIDGSFSLCDFIFLCTPVEFNELYLDKLSRLIKAGCIITDVGSVKGNIHKAAEDKGLSAVFIGGHPMAGSEKTGYGYSSAELCEGAVYPVTPSGKNDPADIEHYISILNGIGFKTVIMNPEKHDKITAAISHVPHITAAALTLLVRDNEDEDKYMQLLASSGFRDATRIASSSYDVWQQICMSNAENISKLLGQYIDSLSSIKASLDTGNYEKIKELFIQSKLYRDLF